MAGNSNEFKNGNRLEGWVKAILAIIGLVTTIVLWGVAIGALRAQANENTKNIEKMYECKVEQVEFRAVSGTIQKQLDEIKISQQRIYDLLLKRD